MTPSPIGAPRHLVVRLPNPAGDVVAATPALRALRAALPSARITWCGRPAALALLDGLSGASATLAIEGGLAGGLTAPRRLGAAWREAGADALLLLTNSWRSAWAARASQVPVRAGYVLGRRPSMLTHALRPEREAGRSRPEPMRSWYLRLAALFGAVDDGEPARVRVTAAGEALANERLRTAGGIGGFFAVSPGAAYGPSKRYPTASVVEVVRTIRARTALLPLILGGPGEERIVADVAAGVGGACLSTAAAPARWPETKALLARAALLLTTDAGPRHVAAALGTPVVVWMGPTDPRWSAGDERTTTVVRREDLSCLGCHLKACPIGHPCLVGLDPARVVAAALERLDVRQRPVRATSS